MAKLVPNQGAKTPFRRTSNAVQGVITSLARKSQASQRLARVAGRSQEAWAKVAGVAANVIGANIQENRAYEERIRRKKESITKQRTNLAFESVREQGKTEARVAAKKRREF